MNHALKLMLGSVKDMSREIGVALMLLIGPLVPTVGHRICAAVFAVVFLLAAFRRDMTMRLMVAYPEWYRSKSWIGVVIAFVFFVNVIAAPDPLLGAIGLVPLMLALGGYFMARKILSARGVLLWLLCGSFAVSVMSLVMPMMAMSSFAVFWTAAGFPALLQMATRVSIRMRCLLALMAVLPGVLLATTSNEYALEALVVGLLVWAFFVWRAAPLNASRTLGGVLAWTKNALIVFVYIVAVLLVSRRMPHVMGFLSHRPEALRAAAQEYLQGGVWRMLIGRGYGHGMPMPNDVWYLLLTFGVAGVAACAHFMIQGYRGLWKVVRSGSPDGAGLAGSVTVLLMYAIWYSVWQIPFLMAVIGVLFGSMVLDKERPITTPAPLRVAVARVMALMAAIVFALTAWVMV